MGALRRLVNGLRAIARRTREDAELDEELRHYLDAAADDGRRQGLSADEARRRARLNLGSVDAVKDHTRDAGWDTAVDQLWRDLRYAARSLRKAPGFSAVVVLTLTLGIGATTAIFSAVNGILLRALPAERPQELIALTAVYPGGTEPFSYGAFRTLAAEGARFADAFAASPARREAVALDGPPEVVDLKWVSGNYFSALGVRTALGRPLLVADDLRPPGQAVALISDAFWARRFGRDRGVVGRGFHLRGSPFVIVGVVRHGFASETPGESVDLWLPISARPDAPAWVWNGHSTTWLSVLGRRRPGVDLSTAAAGLERVYDGVRTEIAADTESPDFRAAVLASRLAVSPASGGVSRLRDRLAAPLTILMAIVALVLLVACANIANLMLSRAAARRRELAMCLALGAGRGRVIRQGTLEALILAALGGAGGYVLAFWGTAALSSLLAGVLPVVLDIRPDGPVLVFAAVVACATAVLFGSLPALSASRLDPIGALKGAGGPAGRGASIPLGRTLVVAQIAVSMVLVVTAGLFVRSLTTLSRVELGFDPDQVVLLRIGNSGEVLPDATRREVYRQLLNRAAAVPGVAGVSGSRTGLLSSDTWRNVIAVEGRDAPDGPLRSYVNAVTPTYFGVMRLRLLRGRGFTSADREQAPAVAVVNDAFARKFLDGNPVGRRVALCASESCESAAAAMMEVVGVAEDAKYSSVEAPAPPLLYVPLEQSARPLGEIQVRADGDVAAVASSVYRTLAHADRRLAIVGMTTAPERVSASLAIQDAVARTSSVFGLLALALAGVGLSGLVGYMTAQRTPEIGVRLALGARSRDVRRLVLGDTFRLVAFGAALGIPAALVLGRLISGLLYGVEGHDPAVFSLSLGLLAAVAFAAGYLPAARAARVDPAVALRNE